jgi:hypothetical protein
MAPSCGDFKDAAATDKDNTPDAPEHQGAVLQCGLGK